MRRRQVTALVAVVVAAGVAAATVLLLVAATGDDGAADEPGGTTAAADEPGPAPTTTGAAAPAPTTTRVPSTTGSSSSSTSAGAAGEEVPPEVTEIMDFVSDARGLPFLEPVPVEFLDDAAFEELIAELQAEDLAEGDAEERERAGQLWQALELVEDGDELFGLLDQVGVEAALGFYEFDEERMVVRGADLTPLTRVTLAHELTHALDDQHFGLDRPELDGLDGEEAFGFLVLSEGSAEHVAHRYEDELSAEDRERLDDEMLDFAAGMELDDVPLELLLVVQLPYVVGPELVDAILAADGREGLDAAFADPPVTSEEALEPSAYLEGETTRTVPTPPADGDPTDEGVFGAAGMLVLFPDSTGLELAERWGGDRYVQWLDEDGRSCVRVDLLGEEPADSDRYAEALSDWVTGHGDGDVERIGETVRLTACG